MDQEIFMVCQQCAGTGKFKGKTCIDCKGAGRILFGFLVKKDEPIIEVKKAK
jgi:DnaJ-class molecular chaperone